MSMDALPEKGEARPGGTIADVYDKLRKDAEAALLAREAASDAAIDVESAMTNCGDEVADILRIYSQDMSVQSVADALGVPYVTAYRRVEAAKRAAGRLLKGYEKE
jgi:DNA-directed RNA polymerase specialized sigma24 family protein